MLTKDENTFIIVSGETIGEYKPHIGQTLPISLGDLEYCKIPNSTYADEFIETTGVNKLKINLVDN